MTAAARLIGAALLIQAATGNDARPLPAPTPFLDAVRSNLARSQDSQNQFAYKERRTDLDLNPFGRLGTGSTRVVEVTPIAGGTAGRLGGCWSVTAADRRHACRCAARFDV